MKARRFLIVALMAVALAVLLNGCGSQSVGAPPAPPKPPTPAPTITLKGEPAQFDLGPEPYHITWYYYAPNDAWYGSCDRLLRVVLTWTSTNATEVVESNFFVDRKAVSGVKTGDIIVPKLSARGGSYWYYFYITVAGAGGQATARFRVYYTWGPY